MKYRALIVDDERIIVNGIMRLPIWLTLDIEPVPAMTGLQALELMEQSRFDLIITDIRMPEMDGRSGTPMPSSWKTACWEDGKTTGLTVCWDPVIFWRNVFPVTWRKKIWEVLICC